MTAWHTLEAALLETPYSVIRGRQANQVTQTGSYQDEPAVKCVIELRTLLMLNANLNNLLQRAE
jgi:hypothetical protein